MRPPRWPLAAFVLTGCLLAGWMLLGLRHTNHDDIYFEMLAHNPRVGLFEAGWWVATSFGRRVSHLLNVPVSMLGLRVMGMGWIGDAALLGQLALIVGGGALLLRPLIGGAGACGWVLILAGGFALHWYFMPPLAYPLHGVNSAMALVLSLLALRRHVTAGGWGWLAVSVLCSMFGFVWPEFNFLLVPMATLCAILLLRGDWVGRVRLALPFLAGWLLCAAAFLVFRFALPPLHDEARMSVGLDPAAWGAALGILLGKGLLPFAMLQGIDLAMPAPELAAIMPPLPRRLDAAVLGRIIGSAPLGFALVLAFWTGAFLLVFRRLAPRRGGLWLLLAAGAVEMALPVSVVALSSEYQRILRLGYVQGALATVFAQAGFLTLVFAATALLALRWRHWLGQGVLGLALGMLCTGTLAYNLLNRDGMAANQQRWSAFALLAEALPEGAQLRAPGLWPQVGVSSPPAELPFGMANYWTERARLWHGKTLLVAGPGAAPQASEITAAYGVRPDGFPIVLIRGNGGAALLAARPRALDPALTGGAAWRCDIVCRLDLPAEPDERAERLLLAGPATERPRFAAWLSLPRIGAYGWR